MFSDHHAELLEWRNQIERTVRRHRRRDSKVCVEGPVVVSLTIVVERGSHPKWRAFPIGREAGGTDVDKLERAILDGFARTRFWIKTGKNKGTEVTRGAEAISDDGNVVGTAKLKVFTNDEHPDPGCRLRVWTVDRDLERAGWLPVPDWPGWRYVHRSHL